MKKFILISIIFTLIVLTGCAAFKSYNIGGIVEDQNSQPIKDAKIYIRNIGAFYTDENGHFTVSDLKKGSYTLVISKDNYHQTTNTLAVNQDLLNLRYVLEEFSKYSVSVNIVDINTNSPLTASITLKNTDTNATYGPRSGSQVEFSNIYEGDYRLKVKVAGYHDKILNFTLNSDENYQIKMEPLPTFDLTVNVDDTYSGSPINASVSLKDSQGNLLDEKIGSTVTFYDIFEGTYTLQVTADNYITRSQTVNLTGNKTINVHLDQSYTITGQVIDAQSGYGIAYASVTIGSQYCYTDSNGYFQLDATRGNQTLRISKESYESYETSLNVTGPITLPNIRLQPLMINVSVINDTNGTQITGATIRLTDLSNNQIIDTKTGGNVSFRIPYLGDYKLEVNHADYAGRIENKEITVNNYNWQVRLQWLPASASGQISFGDVVVNQSLDPSTNVVTLPLLSRSISLMSGVNYNGVLIQFSEDVTSERADEILSNLTSASYTSRGYNLYHLQTQNDIDSIIDALARIAEVDSVQPNYINHLMSVPNDPKYASQWNLSSIKMPDAWDYAKGIHSNIVVAVLDTGIRANSDLDSNLVPGYDIFGQDTNPYDDLTAINQSHGTHMASIIGAVTNNNTGLAGTGWGLKVMPIKICYDGEIHADGMPRTEDLLLAEGIRKAVDLGANIINISLGNSELPYPEDHPTVESALRYAYNYGVAIFAAAGNDSSSTISYPASSWYTLAVGAVDVYGNRAPYSNYGEDLGLVAPGGFDNDGYDNIYDGIPGYPDAYLTTETYVWPGTSSATAQVSAVAGLIYTLGVTDPGSVYQILIDSATSKGDTYYYGAGIVNASQALAMVAPKMYDVQIQAALKRSENVWEPLTTAVTVSQNGYYTVNNIPVNVNNVYIIGYIDTDGDGSIEIGEFFGHSTPYKYSPGQSRNWVNFEILKITADDFDTAALQAASMADKTIKIISPEK